MNVLFVPIEYEDNLADEHEGRGDRIEDLLINKEDTQSFSTLKGLHGKARLRTTIAVTPE